MNSLERIGLWIFGRMITSGTLLISLPGRRVARVGTGAVAADLEIVDYSAVADVLRKGTLGFAEAYMDGRIETSDLRRLLLWSVDNRAAWFRHPFARLTLPFRAFWQRIRPEFRHERVRSINDHYNLGNEFYAAWLDETMTYSSARFSNPDQSLADAQIDKYRHLAEQLQLSPGKKILEIGCGWGGFAEYAAKEHGCEVVAVTLSEQQAAYAEKRVANAGVGDKVEIRIQDFRETRGAYDAVVSIEMIESVDEHHWKPLFETIRSRLANGARAAMQIITIEDSAWETYRSRADFIQQYIFPGGQLPAPKVIKDLAVGVNLDVESIETFGPDYARTLANWRATFLSRWGDLANDHHLDERFRRMWDLYLTMCEAGFRMGRIDVGQWVFAK